MPAFRSFVGDGARDPHREPLSHLPEVAAAAVDARDAGLQEQSVLGQLRKEGRLIGGARPELGHQTSLAISSRLAFVWWIRSLATIRLADMVSRRWRPTLNGVSFLKATIPPTPIAPWQTRGAG